MGLAVHAVRSRRGKYEIGEVERMATYSWAGVVVGSVSVGWLLHKLYEELTVAPLVDEALTVVSVGGGIGVFAGSHLGHECEDDYEGERSRLLAETAWTNEPAPSPILSTVVTQISEPEVCEPFELEAIRPPSEARGPKNRSPSRAGYRCSYSGPRYVWPPSRTR